MRDCGALQFLLEEPVIYFQGFELQTIDTYRVTIDADGDVTGIEQSGTHGYTAVNNDHPLYTELCVEIERRCKGCIAEALTDWDASRSSRIADKRYADGVYMAGL